MKKISPYIGLVLSILILIISFLSIDIDELTNWELNKVSFLNLLTGMSLLLLFVTLKKE